MTDKQGQSVLADRRRAIAELRGDIDFNRNSGQFLDPVFRGQASIERRSTGHHDNAVDVGKVRHRIGETQAILANVMRNGICENCRLFGDLLGHEVLVDAFLDARGVDCDRAHLAIGKAPFVIEDLHAVAGQNRPVAFLKIGHLVRQRCKRNRIRAEEHLAVAMADSQGRTLSGCNYEVLLPFKQECQSECALKACDRLFCCVARCQSLVKKGLRQKGYGFRVGFGLRKIAFLGHLGTQLLEVLNDPVVHDSHRARLVGVRIADCWCAVCCPACVADARLSRQRFMHQEVG